jgi:hypothetical protein
MAEAAATRHAWTETFDVEFKIDALSRGIQMDALPVRTLGRLSPRP